jgi:cytochrome c oxidase subunit 2
MLDAGLVAILFLAIGLGFLVYGARPWSTELASRHGAGIDAMMNFLLIVTGVMFVAGHVILAALIVDGARRGKVSLRMASEKTERRLALGLGLLMAFAAEGGVLAIGIPVFNEYFGDIPEDAVVVEVTAQQFAWNVRYPGADATFGRTDPGLISIDNPIGRDANDPATADDQFYINQITVPVGRPIHVVLKSRDVIHSFFLPSHRVKQDAVPGMTIDIWFFPTREGTFEIPCTELCGLGHYRMEGQLNVVSEAEYQQFIQPPAAGN